MAIAEPLMEGAMMMRLMPWLMFNQELEGDSTKLRFPIQDNRGGAPASGGNNPFNFNNPGVQNEVTYDPVSKRYVLRQKLNGQYLGPAQYLTFEEYMRYESDKNQKNYWKQRSGTGTSPNASGLDNGGGLIPKIYVGPKIFDKIFGGAFVDIRPQGSAELRFAFNRNVVENPNIPVQQRSFTNFDFNMNIQMNVTGSIGEKLKFSAVQNTQSVFNFENQMKLEYNGLEDEIIKKIELGNVSLPLKSTLIQGSQSLFGVKAEMQFGRLRMTTIVTQQMGRAQNVQVKGGAQTTRFDFSADQYDVNRHFFLGQYFYDNFNRAMGSLPVIRSNVVITRVEVWVTSRNNISADVRDVLAFMDMGEVSPWNQTGAIQSTGGSLLTRNNANNLFNSLDANTGIRNANNSLDILASTPPFNTLNNTVDYEKTFARKLAPTEYTFNPMLGFISLNQSLNNDEVLGVAYEYTVNGQVFRVGEFSNEVPSDQANPQMLYLKMLKGTTIRPSLPIWRLMMKNIYSLNAFQINKQDFILNLVYADYTSGYKNFIPEGSLAGKQLIQVLGLDNLTVQLEPSPDGMFDFIDNVTIFPANGRVMFPKVEPFGRDLIEAFRRAGNTPDEIIARYAFTQLYDSTRAWAMQFPELNRYRLTGQYQGSQSNEISLGAFNIPRGSVQVMAGNRQLQENVHYTVDYVQGRVKIIDVALMNSGENINVRFENNPMLNMQSRTLIGSRFDYRVNKDINLGGTVIHLNERPITPKVNQGDEPTSNVMLGFDGSYRSESRALTQFIDKLPLISTKEQSTITFQGEYAHLIPGSPSAISIDGGLSYIDDFEGSENAIDIRLPLAWSISSVPPTFAESAERNSLTSGKNRAKIAWYNIDPLFFRTSGITPSHIVNDRNLRSNHYMREVLEQEVFPNRQLANNQPLNIATFDVAYYPSERGPYNYDAEGIDADGKLTNPNKRWGGIMRRIETNDFEAANVEFVEFWMMDPFIYNPTSSGGDFILNLGNMSEDVLKDGRRAFENGLPKQPGLNPTDTTRWGIVPRVQPIVNAFDNDPASRRFQDVGLDGMNDETERSFLDSTFLTPLKQRLGAGSPVVTQIESDPSGDNYHHYRGSDYDALSLPTLGRYKLFNGLQGNSPTDQDSPEPYPTSATNLPNSEDINQDNTLTQTEDYFEYRISLRPQDLVVGRNYINDSYTSTVALANGRRETVRWFQFRIPVSRPDRRVGNITDFKSVRFLRMYYTNFADSIITRFASFQLVRVDWRRFLGDLRVPGEYIPVEDNGTTSFSISTVNIEENGNRTPVPYVVPPGIQRVQNVFTTNFQQLNEQALQLRFCNLPDGDSRAAFKNVTFDIRAYKRIKMFVHAEHAVGTSDFRKGELMAFMRLGNDYVSNFYEYELPLTPTPHGTSFGNPSAIWPSENEIDVTFAALNQAKLERNKQGWPFNKPFTVVLPTGHRITILGNPNLANVQTIMLGVRNPKRENVNADDSGQPLCGEVWFNELRLAEFDNKGGWAATGSLQLKLADIGNVTLSGLRRTIGFGSIESKPADRNRDDLTSYDLASTFELGKLLPERYGIRMPLYYGIAESFSRPEFNPLDQDVLFDDALETARSESARDSIRRAAETYTSRRGFNLTNVSKQRRPGKKAMPWDVENLSLSYAFTENYSRNPFTENNTQRQYRGSIAYTYNTQAPSIRPFAKLFKKDWMMPLRDFNFSLVPSSFTVRLDIDRQYQELQLRNNAIGGSPLAATYNKNFTMNRQFGLRWDFTRSLKLEFDATIQARVDEPFGALDTEQKRDTVRKNFLDFGRKTKYTQNFSLNYNLPFNKIKILDWMTGTYQYQGNFDWTAAPLSADSLGNIIQNSQSNRWNLQVNALNLYNKVGFLKKINSDQPFESDKKKQQERERKKAQEKDKKRATGRDQFGDEVKDKVETPEDNLSEAERLARNPLRMAAKAVMMLKQITLSYTDNNGTVLPGFRPSVQYLGNNFDLNAPGLDFAFGSQRDLRPDVIRNGWLSLDTNLNMPYVRTRSENLQLRATLEPLKDFRIELNWTRNSGSRLQQNFRADSDGFIQGVNTLETGDYTVSIITWATAFEKMQTDATQGGFLSSSVFTTLENNRLVIAERLAAANPNSIGRGQIDSIYPDGYSRKNLDVVIPAFLSAYTGKDPSTQPLGMFPSIPLPNWRVTWGGLGTMRWAKKLFQSINLTHSYRSTYSVNGYTSNLLYEERNGAAFGRDTSRTKDFYPNLQVAQVVISEQLAPLIGVDVTMKNNMNFKIEYKQNRTLTLSLLNNRLSELRNNEFTIGFGYRIQKLVLPFLLNGRKASLNNDLNFRFDFNFRDNATLMRDLDGREALPSAGMRTVSIKPNIDYTVNEKVNIRFFFDQTLNTPFVSTSFPNSQSSGGIVVRFILSN